MKSSVKKRYMKYGLIFIILALCIIFIAFYGPGTGKPDATGFIVGEPEEDINETSGVEDVDFLNETGNQTGDEGDSQGTGDSDGGSQGTNDSDSTSNITWTFYSGNKNGGPFPGGGGSIQYIPPPVVEHTECDGGVCILVSGSGEDECETDDDCTHTECNHVNLTCDMVDGPGVSECITFDNCTHHMACDYDQGACVMVEGSGEDECETDDDCMHYICNYSTFTCEEKPINETGDACIEDGDCFEKICDYEQDVCKKVEPGTPGESCETFDDCGECNDDEDCNNLDGDYCEGDKIMHVEGVCIEWTCMVGEPSEVEDCYYNIDYCDGDKILSEVGYCNEYIAACDSEADETEDCSDNNYDECQETYYKYYYTEICQESEGSAQCVPSSSSVDCRDEFWCNGQEYCSEEDGVHCEDGEPVDCSQYDIPEIGICTNDPDNIDYTWDYGEGFESVCDEENDICTTGAQELTHTCSIDLCGAECEEDSDCPCPQDGCYGMDWYDYPDYGVCMEDCMCDVDETPCNGPCKPTITTDDPRCTHFECDYVQEACVLVEGEGTDECSSYDDCVHTVCCGMSCVVDDSPGTDECTNDEDCYYYACEGMSCIAVPGSGNDGCVNDCDCTDYFCNYDDLTCDAVPGSGYAECQTFEDCPQHMACDYVQEACVMVGGLGEDECLIYDDCVHYICDYSTFTCEEKPITESGDACLVDGQFSTGKTPDEARLHCGDIVTSKVKYSDNVYASQSVSGTRYIYLEWEFNDIPQDAEIGDVLLSLEHRENQVLMSVQWWDGSEYIDVCDPPEYSVDTVSECDLSSFIDTASEVQDIKIRLKLVKNGNCHEYLDWAYLEINYTAETYIDCFEKVCDYEQDVCKKVEPGTPGESCETFDDCTQ